MIFIPPKDTEHCIKKLSDKYITQMKNCTWEGDHEDADILICQFLEEIGYQDLADAYRKVPKWFS